MLSTSATKPKSVYCDCSNARASDAGFVIATAVTMAIHAARQARPGVDQSTV